ncbi:MAG: tetratricopeptide repeat protein [Pyrinomonadaceae bacterium]
MRISKSNDLTVKWLLSFLVYSCFVVFIAYSAARQGLSNYYAEIAFRSGSASDAATAVRYLPEDPNAHKTLGEVLLRNKDYTGAVAAFENAIALRQNDFLLQLRLGYTHSLLKDYGASETAYYRALDLAPNYSQPNYYIGMMLLETGRKEEAFRYLSRAAERDPELYPQILNQARISFPNDPLAIERAFEPASSETKKRIGRYLIKHNFMTDRLRSFLTSDELSGDEKNAFIQYLLHKEDFETAREVWFSRLKPGRFNTNDIIFDGGFEVLTESDPSGLGWQINQGMSATAVERDQEIFRSGSSSLKVRFVGDVEVGKDIVSQLTYLQPGRRYNLRVFARSRELVSAGPPAIVVTNGVTNELLGQSDEFRVTAGNWVEYKCEFSTTAARVVRIGIRRVSCTEAPCPIFGELSLDDFDLAEVR